MSIKTKIRSLIEAANAETGKGDTDLTTAVQSLISESGDSGIWYPAVDSDGTISWARSTSETAPTPTNIKGPIGETGAQGPQGEKGPKGDTGLQGPQGVQGVKGDKGDKGDAYTLTDADKQTIVTAVVDALPKYNGGVR